MLSPEVPKAARANRSQSEQRLGTIQLVGSRVEAVLEPGVDGLPNGFGERNPFLVSDAAKPLVLPFLKLNLGAHHATMM